MICFELYINSSYEYELFKINGRIHIRDLVEAN